MHYNEPKDAVGESFGLAAQIASAYLSIQSNYWHINLLSVHAHGCVHLMQEV